MPLDWCEGLITFRQLSTSKNSMLLSVNSTIFHLLVPQNVKMFEQLSNRLYSGDIDEATSVIDAVVKKEAFISELALCEPQEEDVANNGPGQV